MAPSEIVCGYCGDDAEVVVREERVRFGNRSAVVEVKSIRCPNCGEEYLTDEQMEDAERRASAKIRKEEGLLTGDEILTIREEALGLSQTSFERLLGVGPKTVTRWENGTVFQNSATDNLLRVVRDVPGAATYLARRNGVELETRSYGSYGFFTDWDIESYLIFEEVELEWLSVEFGEEDAEPSSSRTRQSGEPDLRVA